MKTLWYMKHWKSISKFVMLTSGVGYFMYNFKKIEVWHHPIMEETLYILSKNESITNTTGLPLSIDKSKEAKTIMTSHVLKSSFTAKGSKGSVDVEVAGESRTQKEIEDRFAEIARENTKVEDRKKEYEELEQFNIPAIKILEEVNKNYKGDMRFLEKIQIPENAQFWKINYISANIDSQNLLIVKPKDAQVESKQKEVNSVITRKTLKDVYLEVQDRKNIRGRELTEKAEQKQRNQDYSKVLLILGGAGLVSIVLQRKFTQRNVVGSILHNQAIMFIRRNEYVKEELGNNLRFPDQMKESQYFSRSNFELEALGERGKGKFHIFGEYDKESKDWHLQGIEMIITDKNGTELNRKKLF